MGETVDFVFCCPQRHEAAASYDKTDLKERLESGGTQVLCPECATFFKPSQLEVQALQERIY